MKSIFSFNPHEFKNGNNFKKVCNFGCHNSFCNPVFASKNSHFRNQIFAGGMKFAASISPLLNYKDTSNKISSVTREPNIYFVQYRLLQILLVLSGPEWKYGRAVNIHPDTEEVFL